MEHRRFANTDLSVSIIGLGCYGMSGAYGPADDAESISTIHRALDLGVNFLDTSASYGQGHNHRLIGEAIRGHRHDVVIHSKSGSPRDGNPDAVRGGGDPRYLHQTCEQSLKNLAIETLDIFCMSRVDPNVPVEESVGAMAVLVKEGKTRFISLSECSAESLRRGSAVHPLASLQMEYSLFSRDAEEQGQIDACKELGIAMMAYAVLGRGMLSAELPKVEEMAAEDIRADLPRFHSANVEKNLRLCSALDAIARRKNATLAQLSIAGPMVRGSRAGAFIVPIPGAKSSHVRDCNDALVGEYQKARAEWDKIDELFMKWTGREAAGIAPLVTGHLLPNVASLSAATVASLGQLFTRYLQRQQFKKSNPMSVFVDLSRKEPPGVTLY